jgi:hypothetical protein
VTTGASKLDPFFECGMYHVVGGNAERCMSFESGICERMLAFWRLVMFTAAVLQQSPALHVSNVDIKTRFMTNTSLTRTAHAVGSPGVFVIMTIEAATVTKTN